MSTEMAVYYGQTAAQAGVAADAAVERTRRLEVAKCSRDLQLQAATLTASAAVDRAELKAARDRPDPFVVAGLTSLGTIVMVLVTGWTLSQLPR